LLGSFALKHQIFVLQLSFLPVQVLLNLMELGQQMGFRLAIVTHLLAETHCLLKVEIIQDYI